MLVAGRDVVVPLGLFVHAVDVEEVECVVVSPAFVVDELKGFVRLIVIWGNAIEREENWLKSRFLGRCRRRSNLPVEHWGQIWRDLRG